MNFEVINILFDSRVRNTKLGLIISHAFKLISIHDHLHSLILNPPLLFLNIHPTQKYIFNPHFFLNVAINSTASKSINTPTCSDSLIKSVLNILMSIGHLINNIFIISSCFIICSIASIDYFDPTFFDHHFQTFFITVVYILVFHEQLNEACFTHQKCPIFVSSKWFYYSLINSFGFHLVVRVHIVEPFQIHMTMWKYMYFQMLFIKMVFEFVHLGTDYCFHQL